MTETKKKALALLNEICVEMGLDKVRSLELDMPGERALLRAIEQHEAFRQEVSDAVVAAKAYYEVPMYDLSAFIIAKPDPLVEALGELADRNMEAKQAAETLRAALAARGLEIRGVQ